MENTGDELFENRDLYSVLLNRLRSTVLTGGVTQGQLVLLATEPGLEVKQSNSETIITTNNGGIFKLSRQGRLLSSQTPIPHGNILFDGIKAGYMNKYQYNEKLPYAHAHTQIGYYVTMDGKTVKDVERSYLADGTCASTNYYDKTTGLARKSNDKFEVKDQDGNPVEVKIKK